jgi:hypothetical protein
MTWFRVDDSLDFHPKVEAAGNTAMGLWVRAGAYSARMLTEGFVAAGMIAKLGGRPKDAARLVEVGLWHVVPGGYRFHQWEQANPTRERVLAERAATAERQRRARERATEERSRRDGAGPSRVTNAVSHAVSHGPPVPSRPVGTSVVVLSHQGEAFERDGPTDDDLDAWTPDPPPAGVDLAVERRRFREHNAGAWVALRNPRSAWAGWLRAAGKRQAAADRPTPVPDRPACPIHPDQPTGSKACPRCAAEAAPPPDLRALRAVTTTTEPEAS